MENDLEQDDLPSVFDFSSPTTPVERGKNCLAWDWGEFSSEMLEPERFRGIPESVIVKYGILERIDPLWYSHEIGSCQVLEN